MSWWINTPDFYAEAARQASLKKQNKTIRAWSAFPDPRMGIYRRDEREIS